MDSTDTSTISIIQSFLKILRIIHLALVLGVTFFGVFTWGQQGNVISGVDDTDIYVYLIPVAALIGYFASKAIFQRMVSGINQGEEISTKLGKYQTASLIKYALLEGPALLSFFAFMQNGNAMYLSIGIGLWLLLVYERPTKDRLIKDLPLTTTEKQRLNS